MFRSGIEWTVVKYDKNGNRKWTNLKSTSNNNFASSVDVGNDDTIYVAGSEYDGTDYNGYITEYKPNKTEINSWSTSRGSNNHSFKGVSSDPTGGFVVAGYTDENSSGGGGLIIKYNQHLSEDWVEGYDLNSDSQYFAGVDCDGNGNIYNR